MSGRVRRIHVFVRRQDAADDAPVRGDLFERRLLGNVRQRTPPVRAGSHLRQASTDAVRQCREFLAFHFPTAIVDRLLVAWITISSVKLLINNL